MFQNLCLLRGSKRKQPMVVKLSRVVTESVFVEEISAEATDGRELSGDVTESVVC